MRRKRREGKCHICGTVGELSFEHVPPRAAFSDRRAIRLNFEEAVALGPDEPVMGGTIEQGGLGNHTLLPA